MKNLLLTLMCIIPLITQALPDDRDQPIHITADKALRDEVEGFTVYSGNVRLVQGSMELDADKLTIYHNIDLADEIIAEGNPAKMRQQPEVDEAVVHAHALIITYFKSEDRVNLKTNARIEQEGSVVEGDAIDYFIERQLITAESDVTQEDNKVVVVIPPSMHKQGNAKESGNGATGELRTGDAPQDDATSSTESE
ncbi:MAG: lipopolysaccharide transport periplasmic protein LptA [Halioglobus sp.]|nr:lipopolysaccharide transport periplasmic protein LptA [Halioglobus sp.]